MGNCQNKEKQIEPNNNDFIIIKIPEHSIVDISDNLTSKLGYCKEYLLGSLIHEVLMSKLLNIFIEEKIKKIKNIINQGQLHNAFKETKSLVRLFSSLRKCVLIKKNEELIWINIEPHEYIENFKIFVKINIKIIDDFNIAPNIPLTFLKSCNHNPTMDTKLFDDVIVITMDMCGSTKLSTQKLPEEIALICSNVIRISMKILEEYYPFFNFIKATGDSLTFIHADGINLPLSTICSQGFNFAIELTKENNIYLDEFGLHMRCGITIGQLCGGVIDGKTMDWFGSTLYRANKLESMCNKNCIVIDQLYLNKLKEENFEIIENMNVDGKLKDYESENFYQVEIDTVSQQETPMAKQLELDIELINNSFNLT